MYQAETRDQAKNHRSETFQTDDKTQSYASDGFAATKHYRDSPPPPVQNRERYAAPKRTEQRVAYSALPEVRKFLEYYGLENYDKAFTQALDIGFTALTQRIWEERGYRLVQLPELAKAIKGRYRILRHSSPEGEVKRLLFWQPNYVIDSFAAGQKGEKILALQKQLTQTHFYHAETDGIVGNQTIVSLTGFQKHHNLPVSGKPDDATLFLLDQNSGELLWSIQIASLQRPEDASALVESLSRKGFKSFIEPVINNNGETWQVVRVGPLSRYADAEAQQHDIMNQLNLTGRIVQSLSFQETTTRKG